MCRRYYYKHVYTHDLSVSVSVCKRMTLCDYYYIYRLVGGSGMQCSFSVKTNIKARFHLTFDLVLSTKTKLILSR